MSILNVQKIDIEHIRQALLLRNPSVEISLDYGKVCRLKGKQVRMVQLGVKSIELLTPESTPTAAIISDTAADEFEAVALTLINNKTPFYTSLRNSWNIPAFEWKVVEYIPD